MWWWWRRRRGERRTGGQRRRGRGLAEAGPGLPCFFLLFFIFLCREYLGDTRQRAGDAVSLWDGCRPLFFAVRHILRMTKAYAVCFLSLLRTAKVFAGQKCVVCPLPCARAESARQRLCRAGSGLCRAPVAHGKACESGSVYNIIFHHIDYMCDFW
jgi:hypothetical protein